MLAAFDEQVRRNPQPDALHACVEREAGLVRTVGAGDGWGGVTWSDLDEDTAAPVIAAQVRRFTEEARPWEWKYYSYDRPADLPDRLLAAGFTPEPTETLLVAEITELVLDVAPPPGVQLVEVVDEGGVEALVSVHDAVFGGNHAGMGRQLLANLGRQPPTAAAVIAVAGGAPVSAGRVELAAGTDFAGLWGGGTLSAWRGRGVFRSVVAHRAAVAAARGFRYLQVDASPDSRPILQRLGFVDLATTTPFTHPGAPDMEVHSP